LTRIHLIYRSYGGENLKNRPPFYSKALTLASFVVAASKLPDAEIVFVNDGPIPGARFSLMEQFGRVIQISDEPLGLRNSYRFCLAMPDRERWSDDDMVSYIEDDYLFHPDAFVALGEAASELSPVSYFALSGERPQDEDPDVARHKFSLPRDWQPQADRVVGDRVWLNLASTASTFSARVGTLREDLPIFYQCMRPFRRSFLDHETCLLYQGYVPYRGREILLGLPNELEPSIRGVARNAFLVPFRIALNRRARRQTQAHLLYAPATSLASHLEADHMGTDQDWLAVADGVARWADGAGFGDVATLIRARLATG